MAAKILKSIPKSLPAAVNAPSALAATPATPHAKGSTIYLLYPSRADISDALATFLGALGLTFTFTKDEASFKIA